MEFKEELQWILDKKNDKSSPEKWQQNIDFVHFLGKKCDCVGWSKLNMDEPDADHILNEIKKFCKENGWTARGYYTRTYPEMESDWFELKPKSLDGYKVADSVKVPGTDGSEITHAVICAYQESSRSPRISCDILISDHFRNACIKHNIKDVDFCWVKDKGKYDSAQWFYFYPRKMIAHIANTRKLTISNHFKLKALGGSLPKIASIFSELQYISLPDCYLKKDMPEEGFAYVYHTYVSDVNNKTYVDIDNVLIHKKTAQILISEKALSQNDLKPVFVLKNCPKGYNLYKTMIKPRPTDEYIAESFTLYEKIKNTVRPTRSISEKEALKVLRKAKSERKEDFQKKISKSSAEGISEEEYKLLLPYYQVANGGYLSDEYRMLSYEESLSYTKEFYDQLEKEELLENKPEGKVFVQCVDGDVLLVTKEGKVLLFGHEEPIVINEWKTISQFVFEAISDDE